MNHRNKYQNLLPKNKRLTWLFGGLFFLSLFLILTFEVFKNSRILTIDQLLLSYVGNHLRLSFLNGTAIGISAFASPACITTVSLITIIMLSMRKDFISIFYLFLAVSGATFWMTILKKTFSRARPQIIDHLVVVSSQSFPSGHALVGTATYIALAILLCRYIESFNKKLLIYSTALLIILLIAFSRVYLGVHYPSDVLGGMLLGTSWVLLLGSLFRIN